jgi:hypothetical protein
MNETFAYLLSLVNETLAAAIVIVSASMLLYNLSRNLQSGVARTSSLMLGCITVIYVCDVLIALDPSMITYRAILRTQWIGIAFVPVAMVHLSDSLLATTGQPSRGRRRRVIRIFYVLSAVFLLLAAFTNLLIFPVPISPEFFTGAFYSVNAGALFPVYVIYFIIATAFAWVNVGRAARRCLTRSTRRRMRYLQLALLTPALGSFPFAVVLGAGQEYSLVGLVMVNVANLVVILLLVFLAYPLSFFGSRVPDRVVKTELLRFFLRGPMTGLLALVTIVYVTPATRILGITGASFAPFAVVAVVLLWQWFVAIALPYLEKWLVFAADERDQFARLQTLSDRLLTREDYVQLLEATLAAICDYLRVPTAFVVSLLEPEPEIIAAVGPVRPNEGKLREEAALLREQLAFAEEAQLVVWNGFWAAPLNRRDSTGNQVPIGILAIQARGAAVDLTPDEQVELARFLRRADQTFEDLSVQTDILSALEGLLPQITLSAETRGEIEYRTPSVSLTVPAGQPNLPPDLSDAEQFKEQVRAALRHYWGGPGLTNSRLLDLDIVRHGASSADESPTQTLRNLLLKAIDAQKPATERKMLSPEWTLYNILELRFIKGEKVKDVGLKLAMSEADLYRKQRVAIDAVADTLMEMEMASLKGNQNAAGRAP